MGQAYDIPESRERDIDLEMAQLGVQAESFKSGALYRYLVERAETERAMAMAELVAADPEDAKLNRELRNKIHNAGAALEWIEDAVVAGNEIIRQMRMMDVDD